MVRYNIEVEEMPGVHDAAWRIALWWVCGQNQHVVISRAKISKSDENRKKVEN